MRRPFFWLLMIVLAIPAFSAEMSHHHGDPFDSEMMEILSDYRDRTPASLTFSEIEDIAMRMSVPMQEREYVHKAALMSFFMPGSAQFKLGNPGAGALFLTAEIAVAAGTSIGLYYLLPPELRFDQLDYFNSTSAEIETAWQTAADSATLAEMLPFWGVATGGLLLQHVVAHLSSHHARNLAMENIETGRITFEPHAGFFMGHGGPGIAFGMMH